MKILIAGINGWVASALPVNCRSLDLPLHGSAKLQTGVDVMDLGKINANTEWTKAQRGYDAQNPTKSLIATIRNNGRCVVEDYILLSSLVACMI